MIISVWRYSHLALAVSSFLLLTLASLSGIVLAFEPVMEKAKGYKVDGFDTITLAQAVPVLKEKLKGLQEVSVDDNGFVLAKYTGADNKDITAYVDPLTGDVLGMPEPQAPLFEWMTNLHRSLFLHETGRAIVGITAFLLILIALSGIALVVQRQGSFKRFFAPIEKGSFAQYYHVFFGRLSLLFILALALTGAYLSLSRFIIRPELKSLQVDEASIKEEPQIDLKDFAVFQQTHLSQATTIQAPFSDFPEDYFTLKLKDRELCVNQFTGDVLAQHIYPQSHTLAAFSLRWHTGRSSAVWAIIMAITSGYILFFIYSGFLITFRRISSRSKNKYKPEESRIVILVGSENGTTYRFASAVYRQLIKHGEKAYLTDLDKYTSFPKAAHLIVMTSTYGEGAAPSNAKHFSARLAANPQVQHMKFSVVGFGSRSYQHFCQFAQDADHLLRRQHWAHPLMEMVAVDDGSPQDFSHWLTAWTQHTGLPLMMPRDLLAPNKAGLQAATVTHKTEKDGDGTFLIRFKTKRAHKVVSGDLLAVYPKEDHRERLYSIGKIGGELQLSVKLHEHGLGSQFLYALQKGQSIKARIVKNQHFHFPKKAGQVVMISNGTGIAPFLGMIDEAGKKAACHLYCGFRTQESFRLYQEFLNESIAQGKLKHFHLALSREGERQYVSHLLQRDEAFVAEVLLNGGVLMICGSLSMQKDVFALLEGICRKHKKQLETYIANGQVLTDCY